VSGKLNSWAVGLAEMPEIDRDARAVEFDIIYYILIIFSLCNASENKMYDLPVRKNPKKSEKIVKIFLLDYLHQNPHHSDRFGLCNTAKNRKCITSLSKKNLKKSEKIVKKF